MATAALLGGVPGAAAAEGDFDRLLAAVEDLGAMPASQSRTSLRAHCGDDALCAARQLSARAADRFRLRGAARPDSDTIRWVRTRPSLTAARPTDTGGLYLRLDRFGRKGEAELRAAFRRHAKQPLPVLLDLRHNAGGDFKRMLRIAAGFAGPKEAALRLAGAKGETWLPLPEVTPFGKVCGLTVRVGSGTASSAEILAALLVRYAGASLIGEPTAGKDYLLRVLPVDQDWQLLVPAEKVLVPGVALAGGLAPAASHPETPSRSCPG